MGDSTFFVLIAWPVIFTMSLSTEMDAIETLGMIKGLAEVVQQHTQTQTKFFLLQSHSIWILNTLAFLNAQNFIEEYEIEIGYRSRVKEERTEILSIYTFDPHNSTLLPEL